jgi:hypothetical protein
MLLFGTVLAATGPHSAFVKYPTRRTENPRQLHLDQPFRERVLPPTAPLDDRCLEGRADGLAARPLGMSGGFGRWPFAGPNV